MDIKIPIEKITIHHPLDIYEIMQIVLKREEKLDKGKEHFWVLALDYGNKIISLELISIGSNKSTIVEPVEVVRLPLQKGASGIMLIHNHPSGLLEPSEKDKDVTDMLIQVCRLIKVPVLDHVIITEHSYYSFKVSGLLERLEASNRHVLPYELEKQYYEEMQAAIKKVEQESGKKIRESLKKGEEKGLKKGLKEGEQRGMEQEKLEIAKNMLFNLHLGLEVVQQATGLSQEELMKLQEEAKE